MGYPDRLRGLEPIRRRRKALKQEGGKLDIGVHGQLLRALKRRLSEAQESEWVPGRALREFEIANIGSDGVTAV
jgi:hypothetical protein